MYKNEIIYKYVEEYKYKKEIEDLLVGKSVIVEEIAKTKWYERFLKRKNS